MCRPNQIARAVLFLAALLAARIALAPAADLKQIHGRVISIAAATFEFEYQAGGKTSRRTVAYDAQTLGRELLQPEAQVVLHYDPAAKLVTRVESAESSDARPSTAPSSPPGDKPRSTVRAASKPDAPTDRSQTDEDDSDEDRLGSFKNTRATPAELLERRAQHCNRARDALLMYRSFLADESNSQQDRRVAKERLSDWQVRSEQDLFRLGKDWVAAKDAEAAEEEAHLLVKQALELTRLGDYKSAKQKLEEASLRDPNGIAADGIHGTLHLLISQSWSKAKPFFRECLNRQPQNVSILNNYALCELRAGHYKTAIRHWENALALAPTTPEVIQNIGRLIAHSSKGYVDLKSPQLTRLSDRYTTLIASTKIEGADPTLGWVYMLPSTDGAPVQRAQRTKLVANAMGSGFVVHPGYILTNQHVIEGAEKVLIHVAGRAEWEPLAAEVVAVSQTRDLALLRCPELQAPPLPLANQTPQRASEVMALGYPLAHVIGTGLKTTVGRVTGLPDEASDQMLLLDLLINGGNSGGPLCDRQGRVIGVITMKIADKSDLADSYALAITIEDVRKFLAEKIPNFQSAPTPAEPADWVGVDQAVGPSTVRILTEMVLAEVTLAKERTVLFDTSCGRCNGTGKAACPVPTCKRGSVPQMRTETTTDPFGRPFSATYRGRTKCDHCDGRGFVSCEECGGEGRDPNIPRR